MTISDKYGEYYEYMERVSPSKKYEGEMTNKVEKPEKRKCKGCGSTRTWDEIESMNARDC